MRVVAVAIPLVLLVTWVGSQMFTAKLTGTLEHLSLSCLRLSGGDLSVRCALGSGRNEIYQVGRSFDDVADRLQQVFLSQQRLVACASHVLKTPGTALQGLREMLASPRSPPAQASRSWAGS